MNHANAALGILLKRALSEEPTFLSNIRKGQITQREIWANLLTDLPKKQAIFADILTDLESDREFANGFNANELGQLIKRLERNALRSRLAAAFANATVSPDGVFAQSLTSATTGILRLLDNALRGTPLGELVVRRLNDFPAMVGQALGEGNAVSTLAAYLKHIAEQHGGVPTAAVEAIKMHDEQYRLKFGCDRLIEYGHLVGLCDTDGNSLDDWFLEQFTIENFPQLAAAGDAMFSTAAWITKAFYGAGRRDFARLLASYLAERAERIDLNTPGNPHSRGELSQIALILLNADPAAAATYRATATPWIEETLRGLTPAAAAIPAEDLARGIYHAALLRASDTSFATDALVACAFRLPDKLEAADADGWLQVFGAIHSILDARGELGAAQGAMRRFWLHHASLSEPLVGQWLTKAGTRQLLRTDVLFWCGWRAVGSVTVPPIVLDLAALTAARAQWPDAKPDDNEAIRGRATAMRAWFDAAIDQGGRINAAPNKPGS